MHGLICKAEQNGDQSLIAAVSGALGGLELTSGHSDVAEPCPTHADARP